MGSHTSRGAPAVQNNPRPTSTQRVCQTQPHPRQYISRERTQTAGEFGPRTGGLLIYQWPHALYFSRVHTHVALCSTHHMQGWIAQRIAVHITLTRHTDSHMGHRFLGECSSHTPGRLSQTNETNEKNGATAYVDIRHTRTHEGHAGSNQRERESRTD